jgi:hypothetical protein
MDRKEQSEPTAYGASFGFFITCTWTSHLLF